MGCLVNFSLMGIFPSYSLQKSRYVGYKRPFLSSTYAAVPAWYTVSQVMLAVEHFNKDHKKGFQYLQVSSEE